MEKVETVWPEDLEIPEGALEKIEDPTLVKVPDIYLEEVMASELVQYLRNYHAAVAARRTARHMGDHKRGEEMGRAVAFARNAIALITHDHPKVRQLADDIMVTETNRARVARKEALAAD